MRTPDANITKWLVPRVIILSSILLVLSLYLSLAFLVFALMWGVILWFLVKGGSTEILNAMGALVGHNAGIQHTPRTPQAASPAAFVARLALLLLTSSAISLQIYVLARIYFSLIGQ